MSGSFDLLDRQRAPRGVATLLKTPFKAENRLDEESYRRQVRHVIDAGTVLLIPGMIGSETYCLPPEDRERCIRISLEESNGRVPVCAAVCGIGVYDVARSAARGISAVRSATKRSCNGAASSPTPDAAVPNCPTTLQPCFPARCPCWRRRWSPEEVFLHLSSGSVSGPASRAGFGLTTSPCGARFGLATRRKSGLPGGVMMASVLLGRQALHRVLSWRSPSCFSPWL